jgi:Xaa-Pro dipeptidase
LEVHDMEGFGEDYVGYDGMIKRSSQFGLAYLRLARELKSGFVVTVEPGLYFIPQLIDLWKAQNKCSDFIDYIEVEKYKDFEGIRIEDDVLVTDSGFRILGRPIPKTIKNIEKEMCR